MQNEQKSIAWWDDAVVNITDRVLDMEFADANFGFFLTETYAHDEVYILDAEDRPIYSFCDAQAQTLPRSTAPGGTRGGDRRETSWPIMRN